MIHKLFTGLGNTQDFLYGYVLLFFPEAMNNHQYPALQHFHDEWRRTRTVCCCHVLIIPTPTTLHFWMKKTFIHWFPAIAFYSAFSAFLQYKKNWILPSFIQICLYFKGYNIPRKKIGLISEKFLTLPFSHHEVGHNLHCNVLLSVPTRCVQSTGNSCKNLHYQFI